MYAFYNGLNKQYKKKSFISKRWDNVNEAWNDEKHGLSLLERILIVFLFGQICKTLWIILDIELPFMNTKHTKTSSTIFFVTDNNMFIHPRNKLVLELRDIIKSTVKIHT
jgi:hypothetical protein